MAPPAAIETVSHNVLPKSADGKKVVLAMPVPTMPVEEDKLKQREQLKGQLAAAFRIFGKFGYDEGTLLKCHSRIAIKLVSVVL